ncbi:histidinol-phosphate transaminase [Thiohalophilus sp.]|uniref:histidinol-phosphate transaminase n=1 Tax=Thiohalophilus sp. TaxID=3028392 RepID=UPI002ACD5D00|nr:histidinol-phosphate transaminase [Thiohalophilus sp.]MDZ7662271.1 histidinol-phosphate transaminase [Thiohalophilus sp.]
MTGSRIDKWIRPAIRGLHAYHVPPAKGFIKLDAMENPYRWPDALLDQWLDVVRQVELNRYPDPSASSLKQHLREAMAVPAGAEILLGNGSDEIIQMILMTLADEQRSVLSVEPGFVMYHMIATFTDMQYIGVPLQDDFALDSFEVLHAIEQYQPAVVFLAYPNNPTGNLFDKNDIKKIIDAAPGLVIIDEAYHAFAGDSFMGEVTEHENMLVMRTVSKMGLAGLRLGLLAGNPAWLNEFDKVRLPYNISSLTQASAEFALQNRDVLDAQTDQICADRETLYAELNKIDGLTVYPSKANFILFRTRPGKATAIFEGLKGEGVLIKNLDKAGGLLKDCLRVTVGTPEENAAFLAALKKVL